jgi:hypothetical protein
MVTVLLHSRSQLLRGSNNLLQTTVVHTQVVMIAKEIEVAVIIIRAVVEIEVTRLLPGIEGILHPHRPHIASKENLKIQGLLPPKANTH